jgi:hypothetical protein
MPELRVRCLVMACLRSGVSARRAARRGRTWHGGTDDGPPQGCGEDYRGAVPVDAGEGQGVVLDELCETLAGTAIMPGRRLRAVLGSRARRLAGTSRTDHRHPVADPGTRTIARMRAEEPAGGSPGRGLPATTDTETERAAAVYRARQSWAAIAARLGITRQAGRRQ